MSAFSCAAVLFDLDGTLLDTAPDLLVATNVVRARRGLAPIDMPLFRNTVSRGARAMLGVGLPGFASMAPEAQAELVQEFLDAYEQAVFRDTVLFPGMAQVLDHLDAAGIPMAIVTNKPARMTTQLLDAMALSRRFGSVIGGDSLLERKPHPLPVLTACNALGVEPARSLFIGDDVRDIAAGAAAGCRTVAAAWGYVEHDAWAEWRADHVAHAPLDLLALLQR